MMLLPILKSLEFRSLVTREMEDDWPMMQGSAEVNSIYLRHSAVSPSNIAHLIKSCRSVQRFRYLNCQRLTDLRQCHFEVLDTISTCCDSIEDLMLDAHDPASSPHAL